jgi:hypothetical protein
MTPAPNEYFWRGLFKFNFWALSVSFITENNKYKFLLCTHFSYLVQLMLFYCLHNSRIRFSKNTVPVHSKLLTRKCGLDRKFYAQELVTQTSARPAIPQTGSPLHHAASRMKLLPTFCLKTKSSTPYRVKSRHIDSGRAISMAECSQPVCQSALCCSVDTLLHRQHNWQRRRARLHTEQTCFTARHSKPHDPSYTFNTSRFLLLKRVTITG